MPSLSKTKLLSGKGGTTRSVKAFVYQGAETLSDRQGADLGDLPVNVEPLWCEPAFQNPSQPEKKYTDEDLSFREQRAWERGVHEAAAQARQNLETSLSAEREKLAVALNELAREQEDYFRKVEGEVVRLVLAVARKVLHREAQVDPLLLTGVVRVALEQIASGTSVKLRVPAVQTDSWRSALESFPNGSPKIEVVGDTSLEGPECLIVTEAGTTDISIEGQLAEIERGFMDLLSQRPGNNSREVRAPSYAA